MHRILTAIGLCAVLALTGCGGPTVMLKDGAGATELEHDKYECKVQIERGPYAMAYALNPLGNMQYPMQARREMIECLQHRGWRVQE